jgi:hypothetical protein
VRFCSIEGDDRDQIKETGGNDTIRISDALISDLKFILNSNNLVIQYGGDKTDPDQITIINQTKEEGRVEILQLGDGSKLDINKIVQDMVAYSVQINGHGIIPPNTANLSDLTTLVSSTIN